MNRKNSLAQLRDQSGAALVAVLLLTLILVPLATLAYLSANVEMTAQGNKLDADEALAVAEAGLASAVNWLSHQFPPPQPNNGAPVDLGEGTVEVKASGGNTLTYGTYHPVVDPADTNDYSTDGPWVYAITSVGTSRRGGERTVSQIVQMEAERMDDYLYFFDHMAGHFRHDSVKGRTYVSETPSIETAASPIHFPNGAVITDRIDTAEPNLKIWQGATAGGSFLTDDPDVIDDYCEMWEGARFNLPDIDWKEFNADELRAGAEAQGWIFPRETFIEIVDDSLKIQCLDFYGDVNWHTVALPREGEEPMYMWIEGKLNIEGTLDGQLAIGADGNINQTDDLVYFEDPRVFPDSDDYLALVTGNQYFFNKALEDGKDYVRTHARIMMLGGGVFNVCAGVEGMDWWWDFFGSLGSWDCSVTKPRRNHILEWDWREPPAGFPWIDVIVWYAMEEYAHSWADHYR